MFSLTPSRRILVSFLTLILLVHGWALLTSAYFYIWWLDILLHFLGGLWVGILALYFLNKRELSGIFLLWFILGVAALIGIFWEFLEFGLNQVWESLGKLAFFQPSLEDTLADLLADLLGGLGAFFLFRRGPKNL